MYDPQTEFVHSWDGCDTTTQENFEKKRRPKNWCIRRFSLNPRNLIFWILISFLNIFQNLFFCNHHYYLYGKYLQIPSSLFFCSSCSDPGSQNQYLIWPLPVIIVHHYLNLIIRIYDCLLYFSD